jgi:hypothetical protein
VPARANSNGYVLADRLQIVQSDARCEQGLGTRSFLRKLLYDVLADDVRYTRCPGGGKRCLIVHTHELIWSFGGTGTKIFHTFSNWINSSFRGSLCCFTPMPLSSQRIFSTSTVRVRRSDDSGPVCSSFSLAPFNCLVVTFGLQAPAVSIPSTDRAWYCSNPRKKRCMQSTGTMVVGSQYSSSISTE